MKRLLSGSNVAECSAEERQKLKCPRQTISTRNFNAGRDLSVST